MEKKYDPVGDGDFNREDSDTATRPRKSTPEDSAPSPFARDKRPRIRRVTEQLNERTPRPRVDREEGDRPSSFRDNPENRDRNGRESRDYRDNRDSRDNRDNREGGERRPYERRYSDDRPAGGDFQSENRRRSYNPNFDENNRPRSPYRRADENPEEDNRFNSYNYDRDHSQQRDNRPQQRSNSYGRNDTRGSYAPRTDRNDRYGNQSQDRPRYNRDDRPQNDRYSRDDRPQNDRYSRDDRPRTGGYDRDNRGGGNRPYQQRDDRNPRFNKDRRDMPGRDNRRNDRFPAKKKDDPFRTPKGGYDSEFKPKIYPAYAAANIQEPIRLNKFISMSGLCSRREADEFIREGNITVNGEVITEMGVKVNPTDEICFNGEILQGEKRVYVLMNKPKGFVTTVEDPNADRTVMDIVKNACKERVYPVGRLDKNSLGVLLITNDGELTKKLTHPSHEKKKVYQVTLDRPATEEELSKLLDGVQLDDGMARADEVEFLDANRREVGISIHTGRNRIVRRMFEELGYHVQKLDRVYFAGLTKKGLRRGAWRYLTPKEVAMLKSGSYE